MKYKNPDNFRFLIVLLTGIIITCSGLALLGACRTAQNKTAIDYDWMTDLKVNVQMKDGWKKIFMWYDQHADGSWETTVIGEPLTQLVDGGDGWHYRVFKNTSALTFLFNRGDWDDKLCEPDGGDFSWSQGPAQIWITREGQILTENPAGTAHIFFEKPQSWKNVNAVYRTNNSGRFITHRLEEYRPGWFTMPPLSRVESLEVYFTSGKNRQDSAGKPFYLSSAGSHWVTADGEIHEADPWRDPALSVRFDSRNATFKSPYGAVPAGTSVTWSFSAPEGLVESAKLVLQKQIITGDRLIRYEDFKTIPMRQTMETGESWWQATTSLGDIQVYGYYFEIVTGGFTRYLSGDGRKVSVAHYKLPITGGPGKVFNTLPLEGQFIQTVYDPDFKTPEWAKDAVFYYIFPDRFRNGNRKNDPTPGETPFYTSKTVEFHNNWLDYKPWRPGSGDGSDDEWNNDFYGGDLAGIIEKLDYIASLGITVIYLNPIFEAPSNHKYDTADYMSIDDNFGTLSEFHSLVSEADKKGIRIILDASLNHCGSDSLYMDRYGKYETLGAFENETIRTDSPYYDWFEFNPNATRADAKYNQWANPTLANLNEDSPSLRNFLITNKDSVTRYWLNQGASGWRMDVTPWVTDTFWRDWRKAVKETNPDAYTVAETWWDSSKYLLGDMFDSTMNYIFRQAAYDYVSGSRTARDTNHMLEMLRENYPPEAYHVLMNLLSTHDAARALHRFGYIENDGPGYTEAVKKLKLAFLMQMSYPGAPAIFYGDEVGLTGGNDPENRGPFPWEDKGGKPDHVLREQLSGLIKLRRSIPVLSRGSLNPVFTDDHVMVFLRELHGDIAVVMLNNSDLEQTVSIKIPEIGANSRLRDRLSDSLHVLESGILTINVPALWGRILTIE